MFTALRFASLLLLSSFLLTACRDQHLDEADPIFNIDPEFTADLFERRNAADGSAEFGLLVESMTDCDCANCAVIAESNIVGDRISVRLLGIQKPDSCFGAPAPARAFVPIGNLADGTYQFSLSLRNVVTNEGTLTVEKGRWTLSMPAVQGIEFQNYVLDKMPENLLWGYAVTPTEKAITASKELLADLKKITTDPGLAPGFYSYFTVTGGGTVFFHKSFAPVGPAQIFVRKLTASPAELKNLLQGYRNPAQENLQIRCLTTLGEF